MGNNLRSIHNRICSALRFRPTLPGLAASVCPACILSAENRSMHWSSAAAHFWESTQVLWRLAQENFAVCCEFVDVCCSRLMTPPLTHPTKQCPARRWQLHRRGIPPGQGLGRFSSSPDVHPERVPQCGTVGGGWRPTLVFGEKQVNCGLTGRSPSCLQALMMFCQFIHTGTVVGSCGDLI